MLAVKAGTVDEHFHALGAGGQNRLGVSGIELVSRPEIQPPKMNQRMLRIRRIMTST